MENGMILEDLLKKAIAECNEKHTSITDRYNKLNAELQEVLELKHKYIEELRSICLHARITKVEKEYIANQSAHLGEHRFNVECVNCGKIIKEESIRSTYA